MQLINENSVVKSKKRNKNIAIVFSDGSLKYTEGAMREIVEVLERNDIGAVVKMVSGSGIPVTDNLNEDLSLREKFMQRKRV